MSTPNVTNADPSGNKPTAEVQVRAATTVNLRPSTEVQVKGGDTLAPSAAAGLVREETKAVDLPTSAARLEAIRKRGLIYE